MERDELWVTEMPLPMPFERAVALRINSSVVAFHHYTRHYTKAGLELNLTEEKENEESHVRKDRAVLRVLAFTQLLAGRPVSSAAATPLLLSSASETAVLLVLRSLQDHSSTKLMSESISKRSQYF
ncbi:hypothetical protein GN956_G12591 [Arapaima gigas]